MKAFARGKLASIIRIVILVLAVPFIYFIFLIGYARMKRGYLNDDDIQIYHGYAFGSWPWRISFVPFPFSTLSVKTIFVPYPISTITLSIPATPF